MGRVCTGRHGGVASIRFHRAVGHLRQVLGLATDTADADKPGEWPQGIFVTPNVRAKLAPTVGRAGPVGENVQRTAYRARVARRWGSA